MEWIEHLNRAMRYVEQNLDGEIDFGEAARIACCSLYHFQRMFSYLADQPLSEHIRKRRMSLAASDLLGGEKVIDVAFKYGYASPTAFNRAFQSVHGFAPSAVKERGRVIRSYPPISFKITVKGAEEMQYRIQEKGAFRIVGIAAPLSKEQEKNFEAVPKLWERFASGETLPRLLSLMDGEPKGVLGVSACGDGEDWRYFIAVSSSAECDFEEYQIPALTWAIFEGEGVCPQAIQQLEKRIVTEWLPSSGYEFGSGPDVEVYLTPDPQNAKFEVWLPVVKK